MLGWGNGEGRRSAVGGRLAVNGRESGMGNRESAWVGSRTIDRVSLALHPFENSGELSGGTDREERGRLGRFGRGTGR